MFVRLEYYSGQLLRHRVARHHHLHVGILHVQLHHPGAGGLGAVERGLLGGLHTAVWHHVSVHCPQCRDAMVDS